LKTVDLQDIVLSQEVLFYEDGEPIIDGESGDLRVSNLSLSVSILLGGYAGF